VKLAATKTKGWSTCLPSSAGKKSAGELLRLSKLLFLYKNSTPCHFRVFAQNPAGFPNVICTYAKLFKEKTTSKITIVGWFLLVL